jgi:acyl-CoA synthetase (AMP-forming)/AMP-acid ligase II
VWSALVTTDRPPTCDNGRQASQWSCAVTSSRLHVDGRRSTMIITGGENVWPETVEAALADHPNVADVLVRGVDDDEWGQIVEAVVVPSGIPPSLEELRRHIKERHPAFMAPRSLQVVDHLPRTSIGKLTRT